MVGGVGGSGGFFLCDLFAGVGGAGGKSDSTSEGCCIQVPWELNNTRAMPKKLRMIVVLSASGGDGDGGGDGGGSIMPETSLLVL